MSFSRRLPVYLLLDTSGSMRGECIEAAKVGVQALVSGLRHDPHALETVHLALLTFDREVRELCPLTSVRDFCMPLVECPDSGPTHLGLALGAVCGAVERDRLEGDWKPWLFVMTDGMVSDLRLYSEWIGKVRNTFAGVVGCVAGGKAAPMLEKVADEAVALELMDSATLGKFIKYVPEATAPTNGAAEIPWPRSEEVQPVS